VCADEFEEMIEAMTQDAVVATMRWVPVCRDCAVDAPVFPTRGDAMAWAARHWRGTRHRLSLSCVFQTRAGGEAGFTEAIPEHYLA
jgi:hypothetical protein